MDPREATNLSSRCEASRWSGVVPDPGRWITKALRVMFEQAGDGGQQMPSMSYSSKW